MSTMALPRHPGYARTCQARTSLLLLSLISTFQFSLVCNRASADCVPGQDIKAGACATASVASTVLTAKACVNYCSSTGTPAPQQQSNTVGVSVGSIFSTKQGNTTIIFVAPPSNCPVYSATVSSILYGPSMVGQCAKLTGRIKTIGSLPYIDDGSTLKVKTSSPVLPYISIAVYLRLRTDLLTVLPPAGTLVTVQGVVRMESTGKITLLPYDDTWLTVCNK